MNDRIPELSGLCAEQISADVQAPTPAVLVDTFGRAHALAKHTPVGRDPDVPGLRIIESSVSRLHAILRCIDDEWSVEDKGSTNGTYVGGHRVHQSAPIADNDVVLFGDVGFVFAEHGRTGVVTDSYRRTAKAAGPSEGVRLVAAPADGGGIIMHQGSEVLLGLLQFSLLRLLAETRAAQADADEEHRGFVSSIELQVKLPWDSTAPQGNHVKQLVRRARRSLEKVGLPDVIEARRRFGYRLTCDIA